MSPLIQIAFLTCQFGTTDVTPPETPAPEVDRSSHRVFSAWADLSIGGPTGYIGGQLGFRVIPELELGVHAGLGASGTQVGAAVRTFVYSVPADSQPIVMHLATELAYSAGINSSGSEHGFGAGTWHWVHLGIGAVVRPADPDSGMAFGLWIGASTVLAGPGDGRAHVDLADVTIASIKPGGIVGPWMRVSVGWVF